MTIDRFAKEYAGLEKEVNGIYDGIKSGEITSMEPSAIDDLRKRINNLANNIEGTSYDDIYGTKVMDLAFKFLGIKLLEYREEAILRRALLDPRNGVTN